jgi:hypothetical protein
MRIDARELFLVVVGTGLVVWELLLFVTSGGGWINM